MASVPDIHQCNSEGIQELCRQIAEGLHADFKCPCCGTALQVNTSSQGVDVHCPSGCFRFDCHRDSHTGAFVTGLLDFPGPVCGVAGARPSA